MADVDAWMPLWIGDYLADTGDLSTEEHGAYLLLLMASWRSGGKLPVDPAKLCRVAKVAPKRWPAIWAAIERFFDISGESVTQGRLVLELDIAQGKKDRARTRGIKGAQARHRTRIEQAENNQQSGNQQGAEERQISREQDPQNGQPLRGDGDLGSGSASGSESRSESYSPPDQTPARVSIAASVIEPYRNGTKGFPLGAFTMDFTAVYKAYAATVRGDARDKAALAWHEISADYPGGEAAMRKGFEAWFATAQKRHPYRGEHSKRPFLASVIAERRWHDDQSAPADESGKAAIRDDRCEFHRRPHTNEKRAPGPSAACPECKHVNLREWTRIDDAESLDPAFGPNGAAK